MRSIDRDPERMPAHADVLRWWVSEGWAAEPGDPTLARPGSRAAAQPVTFRFPQELRA